MKTITIKITNQEVSPGRRWARSACLPGTHIQDDEVTVIMPYTEGYQKNKTVECELDGRRDGGDVIILTGHASMRDWRERRYSGDQRWVLVIFRGDSGAIYIHRPPATKGWLECPPEKALARLRKLGIGAESPEYQQGDFLLKKANGKAYPQEAFLHETTGSGHHTFVTPVLYCDQHGGEYGRQLLVTEPVLLVHGAVDGIRHPDVLVQPGQYIVGTTARSLRTGALRD